VSEAGCAGAQPPIPNSRRLAQTDPIGSNPGPMITYIEQLSSGTNRRN
jgi:hypothetical protein